MTDEEIEKEVYGPFNIFASDDNRLVRRVTLNWLITQAKRVEKLEASLSPLLGRGLNSLKLT